MTLTADLGHVRNFAELKASGGAGSDTGRIEACINPILAIITFFYFSGFLVPLGGTPGAGGDTGFAAHTKVLINKHDPVFGPFLHGAGGAGRNAPGIFTMETGHENKGYFGYVGDYFGSYLDDLAGFGPCRQVLICLALDLTGAAADTFFCILEQIILTHSILRWIFDLSFIKIYLLGFLI